MEWTQLSLLAFLIIIYALFLHKKSIYVWIFLIKSIWGLVKLILIMTIPLGIMCSGQWFKAYGWTPLSLLVGPDVYKGSMEYLDKQEKANGSNTVRTNRRK